MNNLKLFLYEIKMYISSKLFIGFILIITIFSYSLMRNLTMLGVANTAPFSQWSYSSYLCSINSLLIPLLLLLCARTYEKRELRVRPLIFSTPISGLKYYLLKGSAAFTAYILAALAAISVSWIYYAVIFRFNDFISLLFPILLFLLPPAVLIFGLGMLLGKINERLIYILIPIMFLLPVLKFKLPLWFDPFCGNFITQYPVEIMTATTNIADFILPQNLIVSRLLLVTIGLALYGIVCINKKCLKNKKAS